MTVEVVLIAPGTTGPLEGTPRLLTDVNHVFKAVPSDDREANVGTYAI